MNAFITGVGVGILLGLSLAVLFRLPMSNSDTLEAPAGVSREAGQERIAETYSEVLARNEVDFPYEETDEKKTLETGVVNSDWKGMYEASDRKVKRIRAQRTELAAELAGQKWALRQALENPMSTPYGSFLGSSVGASASSDELTDIWHLLQDFPVVLQDVEAVWLLNQVRSNEKGIVSAETMILFLGADRLLDEMAPSALEDLRLFYEEDEWEVLFPSYLSEEGI